MFFYQGRYLEVNNKSQSELLKSFDDELVRISAEFPADELRNVFLKLKFAIEDLENKELNDILMIIEDQKWTKKKQAEDQVIFREVFQSHSEKSQEDFRRQRIHRQADHGKKQHSGFSPQIQQEGQ
jgi:hypothetical protein